MTEYRVTVGMKHRDGHPWLPQLNTEGWLTILADDELAARAKAFEVLGYGMTTDSGGWAFIYDPEHELRTDLHPHGEQHRIDVRTPQPGDVWAVHIGPSVRAMRIGERPEPDVEPDVIWGTEVDYSPPFERVGRLSSLGSWCYRDQLGGCLYREGDEPDPEEE